MECINPREKQLIMLQRNKYSEKVKRLNTLMLRELLLLLQPRAFKIPDHLIVVSFALKSSGSPSLTLLLPAQASTSSC